MRYFWFITQLLAGSAVKFALGADDIFIPDKQNNQEIVKKTPVLRADIRSSTDPKLIKSAPHDIQTNILKSKYNNHMITPNQYKYLPVQDFDPSIGQVTFAVKAKNDAHIPDPSIGQVTFSVKAKNDAHIALGEDTNHNGKHYEIVLGGWGNTHSRIRGANQNPTLASYNGSVLHSGEDRLFRISWNNTMLEVERATTSGWHSIMLFSGRDTSSYNWTIKHMMISTGYGATGSWYNIVTPIHATTLDQYKYLPVRNFDPYIGQVTFTVKAKNDAHIALGEDTNHNGKHYEIVLGGSGDTHSRIRGANQNPTLASYNGTVLHSGEDRLFRISWDDTMLEVEKATTSGWHSIMLFSGRDTSSYNWTINHMMISTGWGATGSWYNARTNTKPLSTPPTDTPTTDPSSSPSVPPTQSPTYQLIGHTYAFRGGLYNISNDLLNGRNIWDREDNNRFIFWCPSSRKWAITRFKWRQGFLDGKIKHCARFTFSNNGPYNWYDPDWSNNNGAKVVNYVAMDDGN